MDTARASRLFHDHRSLSLRLAKAFFRKVGVFGVQYEELRSAADEGLFDAARRFDGPEAEFTIYAKVRVRGSIYDCLRLLDRVSRVTRKRLGSRASAEVDVDDIPTDGDPEQLFGELEAFARWRALLESGSGVLSKREREVLALLLEERSQISIAVQLGTTESYVSQLRREIIRRVQAHIRGAPPPPRSREREPRSRHMITDEFCQRVGKMRYDEGLRMKQIAKALSCSITTVRRALWRCTPLK
jgi:RNA polymerase sigma factor (sigma-70 family)